MHKAALLLHPDGRRETVEPKNGKDFKLQELYNLIHCSMIEVLYTDDDMILVIDEEGKLKDPPLGLNEDATELVALFPWDPGIVGIALYCHSGMIL